MAVDDDYRCSGKISWLAASVSESGLPENHEPLIAEVDPKSLYEIPANLGFQIQNQITNDLEAAIKKANLMVNVPKMPDDFSLKNPK